MATPKPEKPKIAIALEPGDYIVSVGPGGRRAWKHQGNGVFVGHGGKIKRPTIADGIRELNMAANGGLVGVEDVPDCNTLEVISHCFGCGHEVSRIEG